MEAKRIPKIVAVGTIAAFFAFARIELANAYYEHMTVGADQTTVSAPAGHAQVAVSSTVTGSPLLQDVNSTTKTGSGSKSKGGGSKSGTGSKSKGGGSKSATGSKSKAGSKSKTGTGSRSIGAGSKSGTGSLSKASGSQSGTGSQTATGTQSQSKQEGVDPPIIGTVPIPPPPPLP